MCQICGSFVQFSQVLNIRHLELRNLANDVTDGAKSLS